MIEELNILTEEILQEKSRQELISKSKQGANYKSKDRQGQNRWDRRTKSRIFNSVRDYNNINMNDLFKKDTLTFVVKVHGETDDYDVTLIFDNIMRNIQQEVKANDNKLEFRCVLQALLRSFNSGDIMVSCQCLHPNTKIKLLDGTTPTIKEMCERFEKGETLYVYSTDKNGDFKPGEVEKVWITKTTKEFIKVTLDNGEEILTTEEHPYMLRDGSYVFAKDLVKGQSLMPMYFNSTNGYETVKFNSEERGWHSVYKLVADYFKHEEIENTKLRIKPEDNMSYDVAIHHIDFNKKNNNPENLKIMTAREHWDYHASLCGEDRPISDSQRNAARQHMIELNKTPTDSMIKSRKEWQEKGRLRNYDDDRRKQQSQIMKEWRDNYYNNMSKEEKKRYSEIMSNRSKKVWEKGCFNTKKFHDARVRCGKEFYSNPENQKMFVERRVLKILQELIDLKLPLTEENYELHRRKTTPHIKTLFNSFDEAISYFNLNHKVVKVERITLEETPVYDIKVKDWENFVVDAGVVLHNCPDWRYRFAHHATQDGYNSGMVELRPNRFDRTNKDDNMGAACKHVDLVIANLDWMMKIASVINNYIKYCQENMQRNYADYIFPQVYGMPYNRAVQLSLFDDPEDNGLLSSDKDTISQAIERGMKGKDERGRWAKDNEYRFQKKEPKRDTSQEDENALGLKFSRSTSQKTSKEEENKEDNININDVNLKFNKEGD